MPRNHHSSRSRHTYRTQPETGTEEIRPAKKFPVLYIYLIAGLLVVASLSVTASFLLSGPVKPATTKLGNQPRTDLATPVPEPSTQSSAVSDLSTSSRSATDAQPFLLRPGNLDTADPSASAAASSLSGGLSTDDQQRKESLADMEFRAKNYVEAERIYREILPSASSQPLAVYHIYVCLLMQNHRDAAESLLSQAGLTEDSPAFYYARATLAFTSGDTSTAQSILEQVRRLFPDLCPAYDPMLKALGYMP